MIWEIRGMEAGYVKAAGMKVFCCIALPQISAEDCNGWFCHMLPPIYIILTIYEEKKKWCLDPF